MPARIGAYEIARHLGSGGMGTVYLGRDPELDRRVAIKVLRDQVLDEELFQRFFREARAAAALRHPNIITVYASGQHEYQPYIAMEFVDGESLAEVIRSQKPLTLSEKLSYIEQLCAGLHFAHRAGIVHRDIKPANIMVDAEGVIRILDFGIARVEGSGMTRDGALIGTLNYMSPEQMLGGAVDHRSDIFAVGAVAYEILSYEQAFKGGLNDGLLHRLPHEDPVPLRDLCVGVPPRLEQAVLRALQKAPEHRFADLAEMRAALMEVRRQLETDASLATVVVRPTAGQPGRPPSSRRSSAPPGSASHQDVLGLLNQPRETRELTVRQRLADATAHLERGDSLGAVRLLQQVIAIDPGNPTATDLLARAQQTTEAELVTTGVGLDVPRDRDRLEGTTPTTQSKKNLVPLAAAAGVLLVGALAAIPWLMPRNDTPADVAAGVSGANSALATPADTPAPEPETPVAPPPAASPPPPASDTRESAPPTPVPTLSASARTPAQATGGSRSAATAGTSSAPAASIDASPDLLLQFDWPNVTSGVENRISLALASSPVKKAWYVLVALISGLHAE